MYKPWEIGTVLAVLSGLSLLSLPIIRMQRRRMI